MSDTKKTYTQDELNKKIVETQDSLRNQYLTFRIEKGWSPYAGGGPRISLEVCGGDPDKLDELAETLSDTVLSYVSKKTIDT